MKKLLPIILAITLFLTLAVLASCDFEEEQTLPEEQNSEIYEVYVAYAENATANGETPLNYEEWLTSIKGEKGDKGDKGDPGEKGDQGDQGIPGTNGTNGADGADGSNGENGKDGLTPFIGENGNWWIGETDTGIKAEGKDGTNGTNGTNGENGEDGNGIEKIEKTSTDGNVDTYTIYFTDKTTTTFTITNGKDGDKGDNGEDGKDFEPQTITVTFDCKSGKIADYADYGLTDKGNGVYTIGLLAGQTMSCLPTPKFSVYDFIGWFTGDGINDGKWYNYFAFAQDTTLYASWTSGSVGLSYKLNADETGYIVTGIGTCTDTDIIIPREYEGKPIKSIGGGAFRNQTTIVSMKIPDNIESIGGYAFASGYNGSSWVYMKLTSIIFGEGSVLKSIGDYAFAYCTSLTSITIPNSVESIEDHAFYCCSNITSITIPNGVESIGDGAFAGINGYSMKLTCITFEEGSVLKSIGNSAFYRCTNLTSITIPSSVESIGNNAFAGGNGSAWVYMNLTSITFEEGSVLKSMGDNAFYNCNNLTSIIIPSSVESIGNDAFSCCYNLTSITIPSSVNHIGSSIFNNVTNNIAIYYSGTQEQWASIDSTDMWNDYKGQCTIVYMK